MGRLLLEDVGVAPRSHEVPEGALHMWTLGDGIFCSRAHGFVDGVAIKMLIDYTEQRIAEQGNKLLVFHDWVETTGYEPSARVPLSRWMFEHRRYYEAIHLAVRSRLVAMGASVVNLAIGGFMKSHTSALAVDTEMRRLLTRPDMQARLKISREHARPYTVTEQ